MDLFRSQKFADRVNELIERWHVPGLSIGIVENGKSFIQGFGYADLDSKEHVDSNTIFDIASCSKAFTAAAVGLLVLDDDTFPEVQWSTKLSSLMPDDFAMSEQRRTDDITVEDILCHRTGLPGHDYSYFGSKAASPDTPRSITRNVRHLPVSAPIRTKYQYCNIMYTIASYLVEIMTGSPFDAFLKERIFDPLDMDSTYLPLGNDDGERDRVSTKYVWVDKRQSYEKIARVAQPEGQGAGIIHTSATDHLKWVQAFIGLEEPLIEGMVKNLLRPRIIDTSDDDNDPFSGPPLYAGGWQVRYYRGHQVVAHGGSDPGTGAYHFFLPEHKFGGVVMGNTHEVSSPGFVITQELIDELLDVPENDRVDWDAVAKSWKDEDEDEDEELASTDAPLTTPLDAYTGLYWHPGYRGLTVGVKDERLFVDARDRACAFTLSFEHQSDQTKFIAHQRDCNTEDKDKLAAQFELEDGLAIRMGIKLESDIDDQIWFEKQKAVM